MAWQKIRPDIPSLADLRGEAIAFSASDRREGAWTKLDLIEMDERFCTAIRRAYPELEGTPGLIPRSSTTDRMPPRIRLGHSQDTRSA